MTFIIPKGLGLICLISSSSTPPHPPSCRLNGKCQYAAQRWGEYGSARQYRRAHPSFCLSWLGGRPEPFTNERPHQPRGQRGTASRRRRGNANCHFQQLMASEGPDALRTGIGNVPLAVNDSSQKVEQSRGHGSVSQQRYPHFSLIRAAAANDSGTRGL